MQYYPGNVSAELEVGSEYAVIKDERGLSIRMMSPAAGLSSVRAYVCREQSKTLIKLFEQNLLGSEMILKPSDHPKKANQYQKAKQPCRGVFFANEEMVETIKTVMEPLRWHYLIKPC